jgi:hypothetical protein
LLLRDIPEKLQRALALESDVQKVVFTEIGTSGFRDAVRFESGKELLLQRLTEGQRVDVLALSSGEDEPLAAEHPGNVDSGVIAEMPYGMKAAARPVICSQCGAIKGEANHWYIAWTDNRGQRFCFIPLDANPAMAKEDGRKPLCGQRCLHKAIQKHNESISFLRRAISEWEMRC